MDPQKRYWLFFQLAKMFPDIKFIAMGAPNEPYRKLYEKIVERYKGVKNLEVKGFTSEEEKSKILSRCWILCLPSIREGLPIAFLEALAHKSAILSSVDPDNIVSTFGYYAPEDDFREGLIYLLDEDRWKLKGEQGYKYVKAIHSKDRIVNIFREILEALSGR